jgi:hypothetical protein
MDLKAWIEIVTALMTFGGFVVALMIKGNQAEVKAVLLEKQVQMQRDMDAKHAENKATLGLHLAEDKLQFEHIGRAITRIDVKLDKALDDDRRRRD